MIDYTTPQVILNAVKEYWLRVFQTIWDKHNIFVPAKYFPGSERKQWEWISTILEIPVSQDMLNALGIDEEAIANAVIEAEEKFKRLKGNRTPIQAPIIFMTRLQQVTHQLQQVLRNEVCPELLHCNQELVLGSKGESAYQAMTRLGINLNQYGTNPVS